MAAPSPNVTIDGARFTDLLVDPIGGVGGPYTAASTADVYLPSGSAIASSGTGVGELTGGPAAIALKLSPGGGSATAVVNASAATAIELNPMTGEPVEFITTNSPAPLRHDTLESAGVGQDVTAQYAIAVQAATGGGIQLVTAGEVIKDTHVETVTTGTVEFTTTEA